MPFPSPVLLPGSGTYPGVGVVGLELDPVSEDAANQPLAMVDGSTAWLISEDLPAPEEDSLWTSSRDMDGDLLAHTRHRNRKCTWTVRVHGWGATGAEKAANLQGFVHTVERKVDKIRREGGTVKRTLPSGDSFVLPLLAGSTGVAFDKRWQTNHRVTLTLEFTASPYWLGAWQTVPLTVETSTGATVVVADPVPGSVPALGKLRVTNPTSADHAWMVWGMQSRNYDLAAPLRIAGTALSVLNGTTIGAFGAVFPQLSAAWLAYASTGPLTHRGLYRVWAQVAVDTLAVTDTAEVALEWAQGDFRSWTRNQPSTLQEQSGSPRLADLGIVSLNEASQLRIAARVASGTALSVTVWNVLLVPMDDGYGEAAGTVRQPAADSIIAADNFNSGIVGALSGRTLQVGGVWQGAGDTDDMQLPGPVTRSAVSDTAPRVQTASTSSGAAVTVSANVSIATYVSGANDVRSGVVARYVDINNYVRAVIRRTGTGTIVSDEIWVEVVVGGSTIIAAQASVPPWTGTSVAGWANDRADVHGARIGRVSGRR
jgi:hypothetical protein